eukprot:8093589-Karenia_brevis.AAC.1
MMHLPRPWPSVTVFYPEIAPQSFLARNESSIASCGSAPDSAEAPLVIMLCFSQWPLFAGQVLRGSGYLCHRPDSLHM